MTPDQDMIVSEAEQVLTPSTAGVTLDRCPVGLFHSQDGTLCLKTEYGNNEGRIDAYIVDSGEFFWGSAPQTIAHQRAQVVFPVLVSPLALRPKEAGQAVAWLLNHPVHGERLSQAPITDGDRSLGWVDTPLYASPPPASPAVTVGVKPEPLLNAIEHALAAAFDRGIDWAGENPNAGSYRYKAANDHADAAMNGPERELNKALSALTSPAGEASQVEAETSSGKVPSQALPVEGDLTSPDPLADREKSATSFNAASEAAYFGSIWSLSTGQIKTLESAFDRALDQPAGSSWHLSASSLSAKESPEQLREAVIEAATLLLERLDDFESELDGDDTYREYGGHVAPAKSRLRAALKETGK